MPYLKDINLDVKDHRFLAEELMQPNVNKTDGARTNMFSSHLIQTVVPNEGEVPLVFTNFENQVGKYCTSFKSFPKKTKVLAVIPRNELNVTYVLKIGNMIDVIERKYSERTTESYGYRLHNEVIDSLQEGQVIPPNTVLFRSSSHDEQMNLQYGINLNTIFASMHNTNYEDGIIISESARKKLNYEYVEEVIVSVNNNDILINNYGDNNKYKSFPDVGEDVTNGILCARRRINYDSAFVDLSNRSLKQINFAADTIFYTKGKVTDVKIFSNVDREQMATYAYNSQILRYYEREIEYRNRIVEVLEPLITGKVCGEHYTANASFVFSRAKAMSDPESRWTYDKSEFDGCVIKFTISHNENVVIGSKITNRYGGKGVVSKILPDEEMPTTEDGERADVIFSCLGIVNRLNPSALIELELNAIASKVAKRMASQLTPEGAACILINFYNHFNQEQSRIFTEMMTGLDTEQLGEVIAEMIETGIPVHQPPFWGNVNIAQLKEMYNTYDFKPSKFKGIETPMILGKVYYLILKHHPKSKFSTRSARYISIKEVPAKNQRDFKSNQSVYSTTPVRVGEQELINLLLLRNPEETYRFIRQTSSSRSDRESLIKCLLSAEDPFRIEKIDEAEAHETHTMSIMNSYLSSIGLKLEK